MISNDDFPITLILEKDFHQCQSDFRDMAQTRQLDKSLLLSFGEFSGRVGITKQLIDRVPMFQEKTEKIKSIPATKQKLIYTINYLAKFVSCVFVNDPSHELRHLEVEKTSEALVNCLNQFFSECQNTKHIFEKSIEQLTVDEVGIFKEECVLGTSVGLEVLGRLIHCTYSPESNYFNINKISQLAQLNWSREDLLWRDNIVRLDPKPKDPNKPYKISFGVSSIASAVTIVKTRLEWI